MENAFTAPEANLSLDSENTSGQGKDTIIPEGVKGWSSGAFFLNWIWSIGNKTWIGLLALVPFVGIVISIVLGFKGREWAWRNKEWKSVEHFNSVQKKWSIWALVIIIVPFLLAILAGLILPALGNAIESTERTQMESNP